jgi:hemerythrin-like domain-containing protein
MDALKIMTEEHETILRAIGVLERAADKLRAGESDISDIFPELIDVIKDYADRCHHGKEEMALFPLAMKSAGNGAMVVSNLLVDHEKGRIFVRALEGSYDRKDKDGIMSSAYGYASLLKMHIMKEDAVFPVWINNLPDRKKEELSERFEEIEEQTIGIGKSRDYIQTVDCLEKSF